MKYLILIGDGMGDFPVAELGGKTPLEAAKTPMMDELCAKGEFFLTKTVPDGFPPGSDVANMSLLGYDPAAYYTGRAPLEAAAMNIRLAPDETAFRCNLVTLDHGAGDRVTMRDFCAGHIGNDEAHALIADLEKECATDQFHFKPGVSYRHLVIFKGEHPGFVTVPPHDHIEQDVTVHWQQYLAQPAWQKLLDCARRVLADHPVNLARISAGKNPASLIWLWGEGKMPSVPTLTARFGIRGSMISAVDLLKGLGVVGGLSVIDVPGATGYIDTNYEGKAQGAVDSLKDGNFVFVHLEAPDEAGHQGSVDAKITAIEDFDSRIVRPIVHHLRQTGEEFRVVVTMDHFTPIALRTHVSDPVPTLLYDSREQKAGSGRTFDEKSCREHDAACGNGLDAGHRLIDKLLIHD
ncbi:MAG: cofactor-independent phosphoglycerate mutase [Desulfobacterales bacterium GWB2_56_26]|nr:MAG: cofactor-independent phosphoglycerate mutase [Desulfobacterales bacterium GWB2_56_26]